MKVSGQLDNSHFPLNRRMGGPQSRDRRSGEEKTLCSRRQSDSDSAIAHSVRVTVLSELPNFLGIHYRHTNSFLSAS